MAANDPISRLDMIPEAKLTALLGIDTDTVEALTEKAEALASLAEKAEALDSLAEKAAELLALLDDGGGGGETT